MVTLKEGSLLKKCKNSKWKSWKTRQFSLDDVDTLEYNSKKLKKPRKLKLTFDTKVSVTNNRFSIKTPVENLVLKARTREERRIWVSNLNAIIAQLKLNKQNERVSQKEKLRKIKHNIKTRQTANALPRTDAQQKYNTVCYHLENHMFETDLRYSPKKVIGRGAYGIVFEAWDDSLKKNVAVKKIPNVFQNSLDAKRILREIRLLRLLKHPNIAHVIDLMRVAPHTAADDFSDVYLVMDIMDTDLQTIISSNQSLSSEHIKFLLFQLLRALAYLESANILHRDLKPQNILVNGRCELRICDFGLARTISLDSTASTERNESDMTTYVVTRWYRAPELLLASGTYSGKIDIWSAGCIFSELLTRVPLFTGEDFLNQLDKIIQVLGTPTEEDLKFVSDGSPLRYVQELPKREGVDFTLFHLERATTRANQLAAIDSTQTVRSKEMFTDLISNEAIETLKQMIVFSPLKRASAAFLLKHSFFENYASYSIPLAEKKLDLQEIESTVLETAYLRNAIREEINCFRQYSYDNCSSLETT